MKIGDHANIIKRKLAVASVRKEDDPLRFAHAIRHLGDAYCYAKQYENAEPCYVEALSIYRANENSKPLDFANAVRGFAALKDETGAFDEAKELWLDAHHRYIAVDVQAGVAGTAGHLALLALRRGDLDESREWLDKAVTAAAVSNDPEILEFIEDVKRKIGK